MIVRKPYAFLIKNFRKIHIFLLILSLFVAYKLLDVNSYVNEFMRLGTYDIFGDPISKHINGLLTFTILLLIIGSISILALLYYKQKPWKVYLIPVIEYIVLLFVLSMIKNFFNGYSSSVDMADLRLTKDLLFIFLIGQVTAIGIYVMRVLGLDMKKFQFNFDEEFLELSEEDREEVEIGFKFDKYSVIRGFKRGLRYLNYFYLEHRSICRIIITFLFILLGFRTWRYFFVVHKSYSLGDVYSVNGYTFRVNQVYYTDKDIIGNVISEKSSFVIIDISAINHQGDRTIALDNFHIRNGTSDFSPTGRIYAEQFQDLGEAYESVKKIGSGERLDFIIIYKVDKSLRKNRFVLYYQEKNGILRKIKLKITDVRELEKEKSYTLGKEITVFLQGEKKFSFDSMEFVQSTNYMAKSCTVVSCSFDRKNVVAEEGFKILKMDFSSDSFEYENMIDFFRKYGKLIYIDYDNVEHAIDIESAFPESYGGKTVFLKVLNEVETSKHVFIRLIVRNKQYVYTLFQKQEEVKE